MKSEQPDIIFICSDQQRFDTIAELGATWMQTPNFDKLVQEGHSFVQACTPTPVCMPARWSMMTGQLPERHGCLSNHHHGERPLFSLPQLMSDAGYATALVGKNHTFLKAEDWDYYIDHPEPLDAEAAQQRRQWVREQECPRLGRSAAAGGLAGDNDVAKTDDALSWLEQDQLKPRFLFLSYLSPHTPYHCPAPFYDMYKDVELPMPVIEEDGLQSKPRRQRFHQWVNDRLLPFNADEQRLMRETYAAQVSLIDHELGRVLEHVEKNQRDTLIIFTSDHGDYQGDHGLFTKSPALYDCLVRIPMIVKWPGHCMPGTRDARPVSLIDILPSLCEAAGAEIPSAVDGDSFLSLLTDSAASWRKHNVLSYGIEGAAAIPEEPWGDELLQHNPGRHGVPWEGNPLSLAGSLHGLRTEKWKFVIDENGEHEIYDLINDPGELNILTRIQE